MACTISNPYPGPTEDPGPDEWDYTKGEPMDKPTERTYHHVVTLTETNEQVRQYTNEVLRAMTDKPTERILYRDHRGGFDESMATARPVTRDMLVAHLTNTHGPLESVGFEHVGLDARNGWNTYMVVMNGKAVGHSDGAFSEPPERAPLLSDDDIDAYTARTAFVWPGAQDAMELDDAAMTGAKFSRDVYEAKITSGELRVVKKAQDNCGACSLCDREVYNDFNFCPGCGAKIMER